MYDYDDIKKITAELKNHLTPVLTNLDKLGYDHLCTQSIVNTTGHQVTVVDRFGNKFYIQDRSQDPQLYGTINYQNQTTLNPDKGIYVVTEMLIDFKTNIGLEAYYSQNKDHFEKLGPHPLLWDPQIRYRNKSTETIRKVINGRFPVGYEKPGNDIYHNTVRHYVWFISLEQLLENKVVYDPHSDYLFSIQLSQDMPIHPNDPRRGYSVFLDQARRSSQNKEFFESYYYCTEDPDDIRNRQIYKKSGKGVMRIIPREPDGEHKANRFYVTWEEYDTETGKITTHNDSMVIFNPSRIDHRDKFEKWLNQYGLFTDYKLAIASSKDRLEVEKVLMDKEKLTLDSKQYQDKLIVDDKKITLEAEKVNKERSFFYIKHLIEMEKLKKEIRDLENDLEVARLKLEHKRIEGEDRRHKRDSDYRHMVVDSWTTVIKTLGVIASALLGVFTIWNSWKTTT